VRLKRAARWDSLAVMYLYRKDILKAGGAASYAEWFFTPQIPAPLHQGLLGVRGNLIVVSTAAFGQTTTRAHEWTRSDIADTIVYSAAWVGNVGDTVRLLMKSAGNNVHYRYSSPAALARSGMLRSSGAGFQLTDTLFSQAQRTLEGQLDAAGYGLVTISGQDSFTLNLTRDTAFVLLPAGTPLPENFAWAIAGRRYSGQFTDAAAQLRCIMTATVDPAGIINAQVYYRRLDNDSVVYRTGDCVVLPDYKGSAGIMGLVGGEENRDVATTLQVHLWETNLLGDRDAFK
jgi:hypothetical protein